MELLHSKTGKMGRGKYCCRVEVRVLFGLSENGGAYLKLPNMYMNELDVFGAWWR